MGKQGGRSKKLVTQADFARLRGVSRQYVHRLVKDGSISTTADGLIDPDRAELEMSATADVVKQAKRVVSRAGDDDDPESGDADQATVKELNEKLLRARIDRETEQAKKLRLERRKLEGELIEKSAVEAATNRRAAEELKAWLNLPGRVAPVLAAELGIDSEKLRKALDRRIRDHLRDRSRSHVGDDDQS